MAVPACSGEDGERLYHFIPTVLYVWGVGEWIFFYVEQVEMNRYIYIYTRLYTCVYNGYSQVVKGRGNTPV